MLCLFICLIFRLLSYCLFFIIVYDLHYAFVFVSAVFIVRVLYKCFLVMVLVYKGVVVRFLENFIALDLVSYDI